MDDIISQFLGIPVTSEGYVNPERLGEWNYESKGLKYQFVIDRKAKTISVSADPEYPFSGNSLFEICVAFDYLEIEKEEEFYGDQDILVFRKDYPKNEKYKVLMVMKWRDGKLSVWPSYYETNRILDKYWDE